MFCKDCGAQLEDTARFCPNCGSAQAVTPPVQPATPPVQPPTPPAEPATFADKVRATAKKVGSSPVFLAAIICFTLVQLLELLSLSSMGSFFAAYTENFVSADQNVLSSLDSLSPVFDCIGMIPSILIAIGLWITYGSCASRKPKVNTAGLTMIFAVKLVQLVFTCLALLVALIPMIIVYYTEQWQFNGADADFEKAVCLTIIITLAVAFAFVLLFYIKLCTTVTNVRSTLKTGVPNKRASRFVGVMCFISGVILVLLGVGNLIIGLGVLLPRAFLSALSNLLTAGTQILFGVLIFSYRGKMQVLETELRMNTFKTLSYAEPYTSPVYIPPQPVAEPETTPEPEVVEEAAEPEETTEPATQEEENI